MQVKEALILKEPFLYVNESVKTALHTFSTVPFSSLPVINNDGKYMGIVTLHDILIQLNKLTYKSSLSQIYRPFPPAKESDNMLENFSMGHHCIMPVVNNENMLLGFITRKEFVDAVSDNLKKVAEQFSQVLTSSYNGIIAINKEGEIFVFNPAAERILGVDSSEYMGKHLSRIDPGLGLLETLEKGTVSFGVKTAIMGRSILTNRSPLIHNGEIVGAMGIFIDISEFEKLANQLKVDKARAVELNAIFESSYDGFYICDKNGKVTRVNTAWERICGLSRDYVVGKTAYELVAAGFYNKSAAMEALRTKKTCTVMLEMTAGPKKGQKIMATGTPAFDEHGEIELVVVNVRDITEIQNLKEQLEATMELSKRYASELEEIRLQQLKMDDLVAQSPAMQRVLELAVRVSKVDSTVLITGESGVGKEVIAKKIHLLSKRKDHSLIKINCGAIPENLLESELFGYEGGAFTGAKKEGKPGMFELASGGTLLLDEIGELPLSLQVKLLRAIQEKEIVRVGGIKPVSVDVRIIAATNKDLNDMVKKGLFRKDLFYRLNVINIKIPPLRQRREDLPPLLYFILQKYNQKYGLKKKLSQPVVEILLRYDWPGNIREVENLIERLVVLVPDDNIAVHHLPDFLQENNMSTKTISVNGVMPLKKAIEELEAQLIATALKEYGSTRKVAKALEVNQSTIVRKVNQYRLSKIDAPAHHDEVWVHHVRI